MELRQTFGRRRREGLHPAYTLDAGPLRNARLLEPLMLLWIQVAMSGGSRDVAFKALRR